jgi:hypothetical protein
LEGEAKSVRLLSDLRALVLLRRIARSLEEANRLTRETRGRPKSAKLVDIGEASAEAINKRWKEDHPYAGETV